MASQKRSLAAVPTMSHVVVLRSRWKSTSAAWLTGKHSNAVDETRWWKLTYVSMDEKLSTRRWQWCWQQFLYCLYLFICSPLYLLLSSSCYRDLDFSRSPSTITPHLTFSHHHPSPYPPRHLPNVLYRASDSPIWLTFAARKQVACNNNNNNNNSVEHKFHQFITTLHKTFHFL